MHFAHKMHSVALFRFKHIHNRNADADVSEVEQDVEIQSDKAIASNTANRMIAVL